MRGSSLLKVTSILMIIFGVISFFVTFLVGIIGVLFESTVASLGATWVVIILSGLAAVAEFVAGIVGIVNWNKLDKASVCMTWGIIVIVVCVVANLASVILLPGNFKVTSLISGLLFPILFVVGANQNKQMTTTTNNNPY